MKQIKAICFDFWGTLVEAGGKQQISDLKQILGAGAIDNKSFLNQNVLNKLKKQDVVLVVISNTDREAFDYKIKTLGWKKYFKKFFLSSDLGVLKPDIKIFIAVEQYLNIPKKNILMVDDSLYHGVIPAKNLSWQTFWIKDKKRPMTSRYQLID